MSSRTSRTIAVVSAVGVLAAGVSTIGWAATGDDVVLGKKNNKSAKVTTVTRTKPGPALRLKTKKRKNPPFTTNARGKVVNLNADKVDGQDVADIRQGLASTADLAGLADVKAIRFRDPNGSRSSNTTYAIGTLPAGTYLTTFDAAVTPDTAGTNANPQTMGCYLYEKPVALFTSDVIAQASAVNVGDFYMAPSFANVVTLDGTEDLVLTCATSTNDGWSSGSLGFFGEPPTLSFTRLDGVSDSDLTP